MNALRKRVLDYMSKHAGGGQLHIYSHDGNATDSLISAIVSDSEAAGDEEAAAIGRELLGLSRTQRRKLYHSLWEAR